MADRNHGDNPAPNTEREPSGQTPVPPSPPPEERQVGEERDANANDQQNISTELAREFKWVEFAQIASNVVLAVVGIIALCIYSGQLSEMRKSSKAAQDAADAAKSAADTAATQLELAQRPWVYTEIKVASSLTFDKDGAHTSIEVLPRNDGNSPAFAAITSEIAIGGSEQKSISDVRESFCNETATWGNGVGDQITLLPKTKPDSSIWHLDAKSSDIEEAVKRSANTTNSGTFRVLVIVCTIYQSAFAKFGIDPSSRTYRSPYFTDDVYWLAQANRPVLAFKIGQEVRQNNLSVLHIVGGTFIR